MPFGISDEDWRAAVQRTVTESRRAQGLPEQVEDEATLERLALIFFDRPGR
jgi:hypothetical protein